MELGERITALETTVKLTGEVAARDRVEVKDALEKSNKEIKEALEKSNNRIMDALHEHTDEERHLMGGVAKRLDKHEEWINQNKGFIKAVAVCGSVATFLLALFEVVWHVYKGH